MPSEQSKRAQEDREIDASLKREDSYWRKQADLDRYGRCPNHPHEVRGRCPKCAEERR